MQRSARDALSAFLTAVPAVPHSLVLHGEPVCTRELRERSQASASSARPGLGAPPQRGGARRYPQAPAVPPLPPRPFCSSPASRVRAGLSSCSRWPGPRRASSVSTGAALGVRGVPQGVSPGLCPPLCGLSLSPHSLCARGGS